MPLYHNEDQAMLADTASQFMAEEGSIQKQLRHWRDIGCKDGFGHDFWKQFAELGFTGILVNEADGGLGMGHVEAGIVLEEIGRNLTPSPFLTSSVLAAAALAEASDDLRGRY
ncbi:MAG: acyl-CoA dehydrogenase family protein, partial [Alphaproteobacteria bacterium]